MKNISLNKFEDLKRNRLIKKLRSNAIAIKTNQIEIHLGCNKMEYLKKLDLELKTIDNQYLEKIFKQCDEIINQFQNTNSV